MYIKWLNENGEEYDRVAVHGASSDEVRKTIVELMNGEYPEHESFRTFGEAGDKLVIE